MSLFRSLQQQPRVITLFTHRVQQNLNKRVLQNIRDSDSGEFQLQVAHKFPTLDQLVYMKAINPMILSEQIPNIQDVLLKPTHDLIFQRDLEKCVEKGEWNSKIATWVDWEKQRMGKENFE